MSVSYIIQTDDDTMPFYDTIIMKLQVITLIVVLSEEAQQTRPHT